MKRVLSLVVSMFVSACQCGPGIACKDDSACGDWGTCGASGFCVTRVEPTPMPDSGTPMTVPIMTLASDTLALGAVGCGRELSDSVLVSNDGDGVLRLDLRSNDPTFVVAATLEVPAHSTAPLGVAVRMPADLVAGARVAGVVTLQTNDPRQPRASLAVTATADGVTLNVTPPLVSFGLVPVDFDAGAPLTVRNDGTMTATVTLGAPGGDFSVLEQQVTVDAGASLALHPSFRPATEGLASAALPLTVMEPTCGTSATRVDLRGEGTSGLVGLSTSDLFFGTNGRVACGTQSADRTFTLTNAGGAAFSWMTALGRGAQSPYTVLPSSGAVLPGQSQLVTVRSAAVPARTSTTEGAFSDVLTLTTDAQGDSPHVLNLHQSADGASLRFAPASVSFGSVPTNTSASAPLTLVNEGSAPIDVTWAVTTPAFFSLSSEPTTAALGTTGTTVRFAPGLELMPQTGTVSVSVASGGVLCADLPAPVQLSGQGSSGSVGFSPVALDFGQVNCGTTANAQTITFTNAGTQPYTVSPQLASMSSPFTVELLPSTGVVSPDGGTLQVVVRPAAIPASSAVTPNLYGDTLTLTTDVPGDTPHTVPLTQTARGALLSFSASSLDFGDVALGKQLSTQFTVSNNGNAAASVQFAAPSTGRFALPAVVSVAAGSSVPTTGTFTPTTTGPVSDTSLVTVPAGTVLCAPLPGTVNGSASLALTGRGNTMPVVTLSDSELFFGAQGKVPCGTQAAALTFTVRNDSLQVLTLTKQLTGSGASAFVVSGPSTVASNSTVTWTVTPNAVPATADTASDSLGATLAIRAQGGPVDESHNVVLHLTPQGARLAFNPSALRNFDNFATQSFNLINTGNVVASVSLTLANTGIGYSVTPTGTSVVNDGSSVAGSVKFSRGLRLGVQSTSVSASTSAVLCAPLPAAMTVTSAP